MSTFEVLGLCWAISAGFVTTAALAYFAAWVAFRYAMDLVDNVRCVYVLRRIRRRRAHLGLRP